MTLFHSELINHSFVSMCGNLDLLGGLGVTLLKMTARATQTQSEKQKL